MSEESWHARRASYLFFRLTMQPNARLVETQQGDLWFLVWRYRRQITDSEVLARADWLVNGAMRIDFSGNPQAGER